MVLNLGMEGERIPIFSSPPIISLPLIIDTHINLILTLFYRELAVVSAHLGNGCSVTASLNGQCLDTSMGFSPLEGLVMGQRSGEVDPTVIPYLCRKLNCTPGLFLTAVGSTFKSHLANQSFQLLLQLVLTRFLFWYAVHKWDIQPSTQPAAHLFSVLTYF